MEDDFNDAAHEKLLKLVLNDSKKKKRTERLGNKDLLTAISTLKSDGTVGPPVGEKKKKKKKRKTEDIKADVLSVPLHRQARQKAHGVVGYEQLKDGLKIWQPVMKEMRASEYKAFNQPSDLLETAAQKFDGFKPRTALELAMEAVAPQYEGDSLYTEAEMELIKAMDVNEAKERCRQLRRIRFLQSHREAKLARIAKIKSKNYHRILKRAERRKMMKEFDELLAKDPEAAKEKLQQLERERVLERATLKHRSQNKMSKVLERYAKRDPNARKLIDDHIRFGKELKQKIGRESDSSEPGSEGEEVEKQKGKDGVEEGGQTNIRDILLQASIDAHHAMNEIHVEEEVTKLREKKNKKKNEGRERAIRAVDPTFELDLDFSSESRNGPSEEKLFPEKKGEKKVTKKRKAEKAEEKRNEEIERNEEVERDVETSNSQQTRTFPAKKVEAPKKRERSCQRPKRQHTAEDVVDPSFDPNHFMTIETADVTKKGSVLADGDDQEAAFVEAFGDSDLIGDFEDEKTAVEEDEKEKDIDLTLFGWGKWHGPGVDDHKKKMLIKKQTKRKDRRALGLILSETQDKPITKLQPVMVPFPYTRVEDFEAVLSHPIGREWNTNQAHKETIRPAISTSGGRAIQPLGKEQILRTRFAQRVQELH